MCFKKKKKKFYSRKNKKKMFCGFIKHEKTCFMILLGRYNKWVSSVAKFYFSVKVQKLIDERRNAGPSLVGNSGRNFNPDREKIGGKKC